MVDVAQNPAIVVLGQVLKQSSLGLVVRLKTHPARVGWYVYFMNVLFREETRGVPRRKCLWDLGLVGTVTQIVPNWGTEYFL
jgi:hypothetical protein